MPERRIVVGVDFTAPSLHALQWTSRHLAAGAVLVPAHVVCVPQPPAFLRGYHPPVQQLIENAKRGAHARLAELSESLTPATMSPEIRVGRPEIELPRLASELGAELLVIGAHGERPGVWQLLGGSAERVVRGASRPVLLARGLEGELRTVLVALDDAPCTDAELAWSARIATQTGAAIIALHVVSRLFLGATAMAASEPERRRAHEQLVDQADAWLRTQLAGAGLPAARSAIAFGDPGLEIVSAAVRFGADLVIVGRQGGGRAGGMVLGSVAEFVLRHGRHAVLVVPEQGAVPEREVEQ
jgi:nucleotide-binding universal stress UspA family protein